MKLLLTLTGIALLATACASEDEPMASSEAASPAPATAAVATSGPVNCATAEADLRVLRAEQAHAMEHAMGGGRTMIPSGLVTEPEWNTGGPVGAGQYSDYLNNRIGQIEEACAK
jgi:hypothetical protein